MRVHTLLIIILLVASASGFVYCERAIAQVSQPKSKVPSKHIVFLIDHSPSMKRFQPPECSHAVVDMILSLAELSGENVAICVVFCGGDGVTVFGDDRGMPTAAHTALRAQLLQQWPSLSGNTPLDSAFERLVQILSSLPVNADVTIVSMLDGVPDSGRLRPDDFPEVRDVLDGVRERALQRTDGFPTVIREAKLRDAIRPYADPTTTEFKELYALQQQAEFNRTLDFADVLRARHVRYVTFALAELPQLEELHSAAGGLTEDYLQIEAGRVLSALPALRLTDLPRIVRLPDHKFDEDPQSFKRTLTIPLESLGEAAFATIVFDPPLEQFSDHYRLTARADGAAYAFAIDGIDPAAVLMRDRAGNVVAASLMLESMPQDANVTFEIDSPAQSKHVPACQVFSFLRTRSDIAADLRPSYRQDLASPPIVVSPRSATDWRFALRIEGEPHPYPIAGVEAVVKNRRDGSEQRWAFTADPQSPGEFGTAGTLLPQGKYNVELHLRLPSGAILHLRLDQHIQSVLADERISIDIVHISETDVEFTGTHRREFLHFGTLGDRLTKWTIPVTLRSERIDYPVTVESQFELSDPEGNVPTKQWIRAMPTPVTLVPGQAHNLKVVLTLPEDIGAVLRDGLFEGRLQLIREDTDEPIRIVRFETLAGIGDDSPVEQIRFELKRPRCEISASYALRDWVAEKHDDRAVLPVRISIDEPFGRRIAVAIRSESELVRTYKVLPMPAFDGAGQAVPQINLIPVEGAEAEQEIAPGETGTWVFDFSITDDCPVENAIAILDITAPGVAPQRLEVHFERRKPLLASTIRFACWCIAGLMGLLFLQALGRKITSRKKCSGILHEVTSEKPMPDAFHIEKTSAGTKLVADETIGVTLPGESRPRKLAEGRSLLLPLGNISERTPLIIHVGEDDEQRLTLEALEAFDDPEQGSTIPMTVTSSPRYDTQSDRAGRSMRRSIVIAVCGLLIATYLSTPSVLRAAQWLYDACTGL